MVGVRSQTFAAAKSLVLLSVLCAANLASAAWPALAQQRGTKAVPERPARVYVLSAFDDACKPIANLQVTLTTPPAKGEVSFREGQATTVMSSASGKCLGARVSGTGIYYTARKGASGSDEFAVTAKLPGGEAAVRNFKVEIADD